jgi:hypothetical protein
MNNNNVFLTKISEKLYNGEFDSRLNVPFLTKELVYSSIKSRIERKIEQKSTPVLNDSELNDAIEDAKETAGFTFNIFFKLGLIEKCEDGSFQPTKLGKLAMKEVSKLDYVSDKERNKIEAKKLEVSSLNLN